MIISLFYIYENFFRHQLSHGWLNIFNDLSVIEFKFKSPLQKILNNHDIDSFFSNSYKGELNKLLSIREKMKKDSNENIEINLIEYSFIKTTIREPGINLILEDTDINNLIIEELKNKPNRSKVEDLKMQFLINEEEIKLHGNLFKTKSFSLNYLLNDILMSILNIKSSLNEY